MTATTLRTSPTSRLRSVGAIVAAVVSVAGLSLATDQLLHWLKVYPQWGEPMHDPALNLLALTYRVAFGVLGGYVAAKLATHRHMAHALFVGAIGFVLSLVGAIAAIPMNLGPAWYPIALVVTAVPCAWLGGLIATRTKP